PSRPDSSYGRRLAATARDLACSRERGLLGRPDRHCLRIGRRIRTGLSGLSNPGPLASRLHQQSFLLCTLDVARRVFLAQPFSCLKRRPSLPYYKPPPKWFSGGRVKRRRRGTPVHTPLRVSIRLLGFQQSQMTSTFPDFFSF